jgi:hypothetical protein
MANELLYFVGQYCGAQAGFYPGMRKTRQAAERRAVEEGIPWVYVGCHRGPDARQRATWLKGRGARASGIVRPLP